MKNRMLNERDLRALRIFCVVAQAGGFSAAENQLNMTKATISRQVKSIEETLGATLCTRGPKGFELTQAGRSALIFAEEALNALDRIFPAMDASRGIISGPLVLGVTDNILGNPHACLHQALRELRLSAPQVSLSLHTMTTLQLTEALLARRLDVAIKGVFEHQKVSSLRYLPLYQEDHALYQLAGSQPAQLPLVHRRRQPFVDDAIARFGYSRGPEATGIEAVAMLVASGQYMGILPAHYAGQLAPGLGLIPVSGSPLWQVQHYAVTHAAYPLSRAAEQMLEILKITHRQAG